MMHQMGEKSGGYFDSDTEDWGRLWDCGDPRIVVGETLVLASCRPSIASIVQAPALSLAE
jgi:hypothetical protein